MASPQPSGHRAVHIHTKYRGRRVEVQLRTRDQESWARIVGDLTSMTGVDFQSGDGPDRVPELLGELSALLSVRDPIQPSTEDLWAFSPGWL